MPNLNISYASLIRVIIVLLAVAFLYVIRDILLALFLSIVLASALDPWVSWFERRNFPRSFGIFTTYIILFAVLSIVGILMAPAISSQAKLLSNNLPGYYQKVAEVLNLPAVNMVDSGAQTISTLTDKLDTLIPAIRGIFGGGFTVFLILVLTFYLSTQDRGLKRFFRSVLPVNYQPYFTRMINRIQEKMGRWLRGQLMLSGIIFVITGVSLATIHLITGDIPYWLVLAFIAGIMEVIPMLGPFISGAIAALLVLGTSFWVAAIVVVLYIVIQQLENNILVPKIMQKSVGLNPIVVILVLVVGTRLAGILGALIAIPVAAAFQVFIKDVMLAEIPEETIKQEQAVG